MKIDLATEIDNKFMLFVNIFTDLYIQTVIFIAIETFRGFTDVTLLLVFLFFFEDPERVLLGFEGDVESWDVVVGGYEFIHTLVYQLFGTAAEVPSDSQASRVVSRR